MAVLVDNTGQSAGATGVTTITIPSFVVSAGANRFIYLGVSQWKNPDVVPTAVFNGSENFVVHDAITIVQGSGVRRVTILKLVNPTVTTANIVVSWASAVDEGVAGADSWFNVDQTNPLGAAVKNSGPGPSSTSSVIIPNNAGDVVHDTTSWDGPPSAAVGTPNQTSRWSNVASTGGTTEGDGQSAAGVGSNITLTWSTEVAGTFTHIGVAIQQAVDASPVGFVGTRRPFANSGPYDQRGFLKAGVWDYTIAAASDIVLFIDDALVALGFTSPALTQANTVAVNDATIALSAETPSLTQQNLLAVQDALVALSAESPALVQANVLAMQDALIALSAENPALVQASTLALQDALIGLGAEVPTLTVEDMLAVQDALIALGAESPALTQQNSLTAFDVLIALGAESPAIDNGETPPPVPGVGHYPKKGFHGGLLYWLKLLQQLQDVETRGQVSEDQHEEFIAKRTRIKAEIEREQKRIKAKAANELKMEQEDEEQVLKFLLLYLGQRR